MPQIVMGRVMGIEDCLFRKLYAQKQLKNLTTWQNIIGKESLTHLLCKLIGLSGLKLIVWHHCLQSS